MFYSLTGKIVYSDTGSVALECGGVAFLCTVSLNTLKNIGRIGETATLYTHLSVREDALELFGFYNTQELEFFRLLIGVSGVRPKMAIAILSQNTPDALAMAIINGKESALTACPGIGKKTAQRVILELKDKISKTVTVSEKAVTGMGAPVLPAGGGTAYDDALTALSVLGYSTAEVVPVLRQINTEGMTSEEIIKSVLKFMI